MQIDLTQEESRALIGLLDAAVKAVGLPAADAALHFVRKIEAAAKAEAPAPADPKE